MTHQNLFNNRETQTRTSGLARARGIDPIETLAKPWKMFASDSRAAVDDAYSDAAFRGYGHRDIDRCCRFRVLTGVAEKVVKSHVELIAMAGNFGRIRPV
jgi:hypothetical protein